eukprot:Gb_12622 [translate_table: standard]
MKKKKEPLVTLGNEDDNRFNRAFHRLRHHASNKEFSLAKPTKESPIRKPQKPQKDGTPAKTIAADNSTLALLFSQEAIENRPPDHTQETKRAAPDRRLPHWFRQTVSSSRKKGAEEEVEKKKRLWKWGPIRSMTRLSGDHLPCIFSVYIDSINGLPSPMNALRLIVKFQRKCTTVQTKPCRVINGTADIDETLQLQSTVICSKTTAKNVRHYAPVAFSVSVCALDLGGGIPLSTHCLDLTKLVPQTSDLPSLQQPSTWVTTLKLTGKVKGGLLVASFACQLVIKEIEDAVGCNSSSSTPQSDALVTTSPCMSDLDLNDVPSMDSLTMEEPASVPPAEECLKTDFKPHKYICFGAENNWALSIKQEAKLETHSESEASQCDTGLAPLTPKQSQQQNLESRNEVDAAVLYSSSEEELEFSVVEEGVEIGSTAMEHGVEMEFNVVEHGAEMETIPITERFPAEQEEDPSENVQKGVNCDQQDVNQSKLGFQEQMELIQEQLASLEALMVAGYNSREDPPVDESWNAYDSLTENPPLDESWDAEVVLKENPPTSESWNVEDSLKEIPAVDGTLNREDSLKENPPVDESWKSLKDYYEKVEEAFLYEIEGLEQEKQMLIGSSDEDIDSVAGEFLNLLEEGQNANGIKSGSDSNYPRALLLREFEQNFSLEATHNSIPHLQEEIESSFMDAAELEIQKAEQALRSKARAKILEDAETKALMQEWGLNEKVFEFSPPKSTHLSGISSSMQTVMSPPPLAEGMGSMVQTRDGGYVRSMDPVHFTGSKIDGRLVMHVSKPVVVPAEMGSSAVDILRKMASVGMDNLASQAMMSMPMEDITGKTIQQIASGGSGTLEAPHREAGRFLSSSRGEGVLWTHWSMQASDSGLGQGHKSKDYKSGVLDVVMVILRNAATMTKQSLYPTQSDSLGFLEVEDEKERHHEHMAQEEATFGLNMVSQTQAMIPICFWYAPAETGSHLSLFNNDGTILTKGVNPGFMKERFNSGGKSIGLQSTGDSFDDYVSMEDLAPLAIQKIEALALEGLKIQTNMVDEDAPCCVDPMPLVTSDCRSVKKRGSGPEAVDGVASMHLLASKHADGSTSEGGIMDAAISLEKWMELHVDVDNEAKTNSDYQCLISTDLGNDYGRRKPNKSRLGCTGGTLTIAMLVQLRDPLRNYESVGAPMIALVQAEQVIKPPRPKLSKQVSMRANAESEEEVEEEKPVEQKQQFKITEVHMAGLKAPEPEKKGWFFQKWGGKKQEQSGSRWLIANGMGKNTKPALLKSKPSSSESKTTVKPGDTLWSISSRVNGTGSKWQEIAALNPHIRNPDIIFANQTIRTK